jgi:hypothetical protein
MPSRARTSQRIGHALSVGVVMLALTGCPPGFSGGGIIVPQADATPPTVTVGTGQPGGASVSVSAGGSTQAGTLISKSGPLNVSISANDPESGVQSMELFYTSTVLTCTPTLCTGPASHGLVGAPRFSSVSPQKHPGETTAASSILADALNLTAEIPQGGVASGNSRIVKLYFWGVAKNNLGGTATTPELVLTWREP